MIFAWVALLFGIGIAIVWSSNAMPARWSVLPPLALLVLYLLLAPLVRDNPTLRQLLTPLPWLAGLWWSRIIIKKLGHAARRIFDIAAFWPWIAIIAVSPLVEGNASTGFTVAGSSLLGGLIFVYGIIFGIFWIPSAIVILIVVAVKDLRTPDPPQDT